MADSTRDRPGSFKIPPRFRGGGHPACRRAGASRPAEKTFAHTNRAELFPNRAQLPTIFPGGGMLALHGRRDICPQNVFAAPGRGTNHQMAI